MKIQQAMGGMVVITSLLALNISSDVMLAETIKAKNCDDLIRTIDQKQCYQDSYHLADKKLNQAYKKLNNRLKSSDRANKEPQESLIASQQAWIKFRDTNCIFRSSGWGGTTRAVIQLACLERMTKERTSELEQMLNN